MAARLGLHEERTRIVLHLPHNNPSEAQALANVISFLRQKQLRRRGQGKVTGYTMTRPRWSSYVGYWWSPRLKKWVRDKLVIIILDHEYEIDAPHLDTELDQWKREIHRLYFAAGAKQDEIWIAAHPVYRYD